MFDYYDKTDYSTLASCTLCPRECSVNRFRGADGYCGTDAGFNIASICIHRGEEPPISGPSGICNIFFAGCNLRCIYCQNNDISRTCSDMKRFSMESDSVLDQVEAILDKGIKTVGFVSPSHSVPQMKAIIKGLNKRGREPVIVYNTNSYDKQSVLREIEGLIDVWLPDLKYVTDSISASYSDAYNYPEVAVKALKEMYYQKGSKLHLDDDGSAVQGLMIRHLVLPGHSEESKSVLRRIAEELSTGVSISLMSQYHPTLEVRGHKVLDRPLYAEEYHSVAEEMVRLGFRNGWCQDPESFDNYLPDFSKEHPFEQE
jgi:putative pyruvate formate lyase activating enzyme